MDWASEKDALNNHRLDGRTGPVSTQFGPVVPEMLPTRSLRTDAVRAKMDSSNRVDGAKRR